MAAAILRGPGCALVHNQAGANMAGGIATTLLGAARPAAGSRASSACSRSTSCGWPRVAARAGTARDPARQPVPRPARPLRRARDDRRQLGSELLAAGAGTEPRAERRRPADRRPRPRAPAGAATSASRTTRWRCPAWPTRPTRSTAAAAARRTCSTPSTSATSATTTARSCGQRRPAPAVTASEVTPAGRARRAIHAAHARGRGARRSSPCPGSTTSTTRSPQPPWRARWRSRSQTIAPGLAEPAAAFGRAETRHPRRLAAALGPRTARRGAADPARQEPGGGQRGAAHARARARRARPARGAQRQASPTAATSPGSGTPTSSCWRGGSGASPAAAAAPPTSRCG